MNKKELIDQVVEETDFTRSDITKVVNTLLDVLKQGIQKDGTVQIIGLGTFDVKKRAAREGRNPQTGEKIRIKASKTVRFRPGKGLKESL